jgi:hypothetical protein
LRLALSKGPNTVGVSLTSLEDGNESSFRNVVFFSSYLEFEAMDILQKPSDFELYFEFDCNYSRDVNIKNYCKFAMHFPLNVWIIRQFNSLRPDIST